MNYKAALVALSVLGAALVVAGVVAFFTLQQRESSKLSTWSNEKLVKELGEPVGQFDCGQEGLAPGTMYVDDKNLRIVYLCVPAAR